MDVSETYSNSGCIVIVTTANFYWVFTTAKPCTKHLTHSPHLFFTAIAVIMPYFTDEATET